MSDSTFGREGLRSLALKAPNKLAIGLGLALFFATTLPVRGQEVPTLYTTWTAAPFGPNIRQAGRVNAIAVSPRSDRIVLAGTETGGLFRSTDGAETFTHIPALNKQTIFDIKFVGASGTVVIAATIRDFKTDPNNAIWRSTDAGMTWTPLRDPPAHPYFPRRAEAYCVVEASGTIYVGTNRGISKSTDEGVTWTHGYVFPPASGMDPEVIAVEPFNGGILAGGKSGLRRWTPDTAEWRAVVREGDLPIRLNSPFALDASADLALAVDSEKRLFRSVDGGRTWRVIPSAPGSGDGAGGKVLVKQRYRSFNEIDIFFGNRYGLYRLRVSRPNINSAFNFEGSWTDLARDHHDTRCFVLTNTNEPYLLCTDGGLHKTRDGGETWPFTAGSRAGLNALQITEVTGQIITNAGRHDLYFGTQDNNLYASSDGGVTWPDTNMDSAEGFFIKNLRRVANDDDAATINYRRCSDCLNKISGTLFHNGVAWRNPPNPVDAPVRLSDTTHIQLLGTAGAFGLAQTTDKGASWTRVANFPEQTWDLPKFVRGEQTTIYQPVKYGWDDARGVDFYRLVKITLARDGRSWIRYPNNVGFGGLGVTATEFAWYRVFDVDPGNARHLIAVDGIREKVVRSVDAGESWSDLDSLTRMVTRDGAYRFTWAEGWNRQTLVSAISFNPDNPNFVLIGTNEGGVYTSSDRGATWQGVPRTDMIRPISSFYWRNWNDVIVSTYGRGLWRLRGTMRIRWQSRQSILAPDSQSTQLSTTAQLSAQPVSLMFFSGSMTGIEMIAGKITRIHVAPGTSYLIASDDDKAASDIEVIESPKEIGFVGFEEVPKPPQEGWVVVGLTFEKDGVMEVVYAPRPVEFPGSRDQTIDKPQPNDPSPTTKQPYIYLMHASAQDGDNRSFKPGETVLVRAVRFDPESAASLELTLNGQPVKANIKWGQGGDFQAEFPAPFEFGAHSIVARQKSSRGELVDGATFLVRHSDDGDKPGNQKPK